MSDGMSANGTAKNYVSYSDGFKNFIRSKSASPSLNLGCGALKIGTVNVDIDESCNPEFVFDLEKPPYPFEPGSFKTIIALDVFEHLHGIENVIGECKRLLASSGSLIIAVPHKKSKYYTHGEHVNFFTEENLKEMLSGFDIRFLNYRGDTRNMPVSLSLLLGKIKPNKIVCIARKKKSG